MRRRLLSSAESPSAAGSPSAAEREANFTFDAEREANFTFGAGPAAAQAFAKDNTVA